MRTCSFVLRGDRVRSCDHTLHSHSSYCPSACAGTAAASRCRNARPDPLVQQRRDIRQSADGAVASRCKSLGLRDVHHMCSRSRVTCLRARNSGDGVGSCNHAHSIVPRRRGLPSGLVQGTVAVQPFRDSGRPPSWTAGELMCNSWLVRRDVDGCFAPAEAAWELLPQLLQGRGGWWLAAHEAEQLGVVRGGSAR
jgi:hypothetical protein